jgi:hypothetical protein
MYYFWVALFIRCGWVFVVMHTGPKPMRFPEELWRLVELEAERTGETLTAVVRRAIEADLLPRERQIRVDLKRVREERALVLEAATPGILAGVMMILSAFAPFFW